MTDLVYFPDDRPGITRLRCGRGFRYRAPDGTTIADPHERARLAGLAVPPAYENVWMSPLRNGHLQATGHDQRNRKQYRYHAEWTAVQSEKKFERLIDFATALPRIRRKAQALMAADAGDKDFALGCAVMMIDRFAMRVGNPDYTRDNGSYGALTLRRRHVKLSKDRIALSYTAKGGKKVRKSLADRTLSRLLHKVGEIPGAELLTWIDETGEAHALGANDLNGFLADTTDQSGVTAKTFRTWAGSVAAYEVAEATPATIKAMSEAAAKRLHNTPTIARSSYIHPAVIDLAGTDVSRPIVTSPSGLRASERRLLSFLQSGA